MTTVHPFSDAPVMSVETLRALLVCDEAAGLLFWKERGPEWFTGQDRFSSVVRSKMWNTRHAGKPAFTGLRNGYFSGQLFAKTYSAHRVIWAMAHGYWPNGDIDHANGNRLDNRLSNLREATRAENNRNVGVQANNTSGFKGVSWDAAHSKWKARIGHHRKIIHLGRFESPEDAYAAYCAAAQKYHKQFARLA